MRRAGHAAGHRGASAAPQSHQPPPAPHSAPHRPDPPTERVRLEQIIVVYPVPPPRSGRVVPESIAQNRVRTVLEYL